MAFKIYGKKNCAGCDQAKTLLDNVGIGYEYVDIISNPQAMKKLMDMGLRGVPQVFYNEQHLGGADRLSLFLRDDMGN